jgi:hypothetical protein
VIAITTQHRRRRLSHRANCQTGSPTRFRKPSNAQTRHPSINTACDEQKGSLTCLDVSDVGSCGDVTEKSALASRNGCVGVVVLLNVPLSVGTTACEFEDEEEEESASSKRHRISPKALAFKEGVTAGFPPPRRLVSLRLVSDSSPRTYSFH